MATYSNFSQFSQKLRQAAAKFETDVKEAVEFNIGEMELQAIRDAPGPSDNIRVDGGVENERNIVGSNNWTPISQTIGYTLTNNGLKATLYVEKSAGDIAAWVEFGTGQSAQTYLATVPTEWRATAAKYIRNKKGTIINQPYILPAFMKYKEEFLADLKKVVKDFGKGI